MNPLLVPHSSSVSLLTTLEIWIHLFPIVSDMIWKTAVQREMMDAFRSVHMDILQAIENQPSGGTMGKSGTTATVLFIFEEAVVLANVGDSSAVLSVGASYTNIPRKELPASMVLTVYIISQVTWMTCLLPSRGTDSDLA
jgi:hypothetical protein